MISKRSFAVLALLTSPLFSGCHVAVSSTGNQTIEGVWHPTSGDAFDALPANELRYLQLDPDGTGMVFGSTPVSQARSCSPLAWAVVNETTVMIDVPEGGGRALYLFEHPGESSLRLVGTDARRTDFERLDGLPAGVACGSAAPIAAIAFPNVPRRTNTSSLVAIGPNIAYESTGDGYGGVISLMDPSGALASTLTPASQITGLVAAESGDFWMTYGTTLQRRTVGDTLVEDVDLVALTGLPYYSISVGAATVDPVSGHLFVDVRYYDDVTYLQHDRIVEIDTAAEPDILVAQNEIDFPSTGLVFHQGALWALTRTSSPVLVQLQGGFAARTVRLPWTGDGEWNGLAEVDGKVYTHLTRYDSDFQKDTLMGFDSL